MSLQPHLKMAAYWLPFSPTVSRLFGLGLVPLLEMDEDMSSKKHTREVSMMLAKNISASGGARPKSSPQPRLTVNGGEGEAHQEAVATAAEAKATEVPEEPQTPLVSRPLPIRRVMATKGTKETSQLPSPPRP